MTRQTLVDQSISVDSHHSRFARPHAAHRPAMQPLVHPAGTASTYGAGDSYYYSGYFAADRADDLCTRLQHEMTQLYVPRQEMVFASTDAPSRCPATRPSSATFNQTYVSTVRYNKGGDYPAVRPWTPITQTIRDALAQTEKQVANHLVANRYRLATTTSAIHTMTRHHASHHMSWYTCDV